MADVYNQNDLNKSYEDVAINNFVNNDPGKGTAFRHIISKVALDNPTVTIGIESLINEKINPCAARQVYHGIGNKTFRTLPHQAHL